MTGAKKRPPRRRDVWPWLPVLAMYATIFWFSAQPGEISDAQSAIVKGWIGPDWEWLEGIVRKLAHVALFLGLGAAAAFAWLRREGEPKRFGRVLARAVILCAALAASDEFHQLFVPGRSALVSDVLLDTVSATLGALGVAGIARRRGGG